MKKVFLLTLAVMTTALLNVFAYPIDSYQKLAAAMRQGKQFVIVLDLEKCTGKTGMPTGYFNPSAMMLIPASETAPEHVTTSHLHFTNHSGNPTYEYVKYTFYSDGSIVVKTTFYNAPSFNEIGQSHTFTSSINKGVYIDSSEKPKMDYAGPPMWMIRPH